MAALTFLILTVAQWVVGDFKGLAPTPVIYGGDRVAIEEAPYVAIYHSMEWNGSMYLESLCGGSILSEKFVLSAAHCYDRTPNILHFVIVGTDVDDKKTGQMCNIERTIVHPKYDEDTNDYDVLVIKLQNKLSFSERVQPIKMADPDYMIDEGSSFNVYGFGFDEQNSEYLKGVKVSYINQEECAKYDSETDLTDRMICAGDPGKDSCRGDSGGPLVIEEVNEVILVGVVSFGLGLTDEDCGKYPGIYTSVPSVRKFIDDTIKSNS